MFLFELAGNRVLVTENEMHLGARASEIRTEHDDPRRVVRKFLAAGLETIFQ